MALSVIRTNQGLVQPSKKTPSGTLDLSIIDRLPVLRCNARTLHVFRHGPGAAQVIREALSMALVPYYPLAGRLKEPSHGELQIECSGEGVWFVEASAECMLDSVHYFDDTASIPYDELLPDHIPEAEGINPLVLMQVYGQKPLCSIIHSILHCSRRISKIQLLKLAQTQLETIKKNLKTGW